MYLRLLFKVPLCGNAWKVNLMNNAANLALHSVWLVFQKTKGFFPATCEIFQSLMAWENSPPFLSRAVLIKTKHTNDNTAHQTKPMARTRVAMTPEMSKRNVLIKKLWMLLELWFDSKCQLQRTGIFDSENWVLCEFSWEHDYSIKSQAYFCFFLRWNW